MFIDLPLPKYLSIKHFEPKKIVFFSCREIFKSWEYCTPVCDSENISQKNGDSNRAEEKVGSSELLLEKAKNILYSL